MEVSSLDAYGNYIEAIGRRRVAPKQSGVSSVISWLHNFFPPFPCVKSLIPFMLHS